MIIDKITPDQAQNIQEFIQDIISQSEIYLPQWSKQEWHDYLGTSSAYGLKITNNGKLCAILLTNLVLGEADILMIATDTLYRRQGLASRLLENLQATCTKISLEVESQNLIAIKFYQNLGFKQVGIRKFYYQENNGDALCLIWDNPLHQDKIPKII